LQREFFEGLTTIDAAIVDRAAKEPCRDCGGPLHRGDYPRKPRGGLLAIAAEAFGRRFSLCCGREGCRRRVTPPSVRFLGASGVRRGRRDPRERGRAGGCHGKRGHTDDGRTGPHHAPVAALVARAVHDDGAVCRPLSASCACTRSSSVAHLALGTTRRRRDVLPREAHDLARADHDDELPGRIALREGRDVTALRHAPSRRRWRSHDFPIGVGCLSPPR